MGYSIFDGISDLFTLGGKSTYDVLSGKYGDSVRDPGHFLLSLIQRSLLKSNGNGNRKSMMRILNIRKLMMNIRKSLILYRWKERIMQFRGASLI